LRYLFGDIGLPSILLDPDLRFLSIGICVFLLIEHHHQVFKLLFEQVDDLILPRDFSPELINLLLVGRFLFIQQITTEATDSGYPFAGFLFKLLDLF
jgi:hypothetical protein